jgi:transposase-like protein
MATTGAELLTEEGKRDQRGRRITSAPRRAELLEAYRASGLTMKQFGRQEGINPFTLAKWATNAGRRGVRGSVQFAEMKVGFPMASSWVLEVTLPNGLPVRAANAAALVELLSLVRK